MSRKIASLSAQLIEIPNVDKLKIALQPAILSQFFAVVTLRLDNGTVGVGEAPVATFLTGETGNSILTAINEMLAPVLVGHDAFDLYDLHQTMKRVLPAGNSGAKCAVDLALYDAIGRDRELPVSCLLGGAPRGPIDTAKAISTGPVADMVATAGQFVAQGLRTVKLKTGMDAESELGALRAIRKAHPKLKIKLDANQGWTLPEAIRFLDKAEPYDVEMIEQPLPAADLKGAAELRRRTSIPVMLDESIHGADDALRAVEAGACDYMNIKLLKSGGLFPALGIVAVCEAAGLSCMIGSMSTSIGTAASMHLVHARPTVRFAEIAWPTRLAFDIASGFKMANGAAEIESRPGLGVKVNHSDLVARAA
jgi:L-Ala-D/L-Glu epimerase